MTLLLEDGTGVTDANSYVNRTYADAYFAERGIATWTGTTTAKDEALIKASDYIDQRWGRRFAGTKQFDRTVNQLTFPRLGLYDRDGRYVEGVPDLLKRATCEYALRALTSTLMPDPSTQSNISSLRQKVGPIEEETVYRSSAAGSATSPDYPMADSWLAEYLGAGQGVYR